MSHAPPRLSVITVVGGAPGPEARAIASLAPGRQAELLPGEGELVVVERASARPLGEAAVLAAAPGARYVAVDREGLADPALLAAGLAVAAAPFVGVVLDGAHLATPRLLEHALLACRAHDLPVAAAPGRHLGERAHGEAPDDLPAEDEDRALVAALGGGYALLEASVPDPAAPGGYLAPFAEAPGLFCPRGELERVLGAAPAFEVQGEAMAYLLAALTALPGSRLYSLGSEALIHQRHPCRSAREAASRHASVLAARRRWFGRILPPREPHLLAACSAEALGELERSSREAVLYHELRRSAGKPSFPVG